MTSQPLDLFDGEAKQNAITLIRRFVNFMDQHQDQDVDITAFVNDFRDFLEDPYMEPWGNIEVAGSRALADASRQGEK